MGLLAERVGGADMPIGYVNLLAALYFLRMTRPEGRQRAVAGLDDDNKEPPGR